MLRTKSFEAQNGKVHLCHIYQSSTEAIVWKYEKYLA